MDKKLDIPVQEWKVVNKNAHRLGMKHQVLSVHYSHESACDSLQQLRTWNRNGNFAIIKTQ